MPQDRPERSPDTLVSLCIHSLFCRRDFRRLADQALPKLCADLHVRVVKHQSPDFIATQKAVDSNVRNKQLTMGTGNSTPVYMHERKLMLKIKEGVQPSYSRVVRRIKLLVQVTTIPIILDGHIFSCIAFLKLTYSTF